MAHIISTIKKIYYNIWYLLVEKPRGLDFIRVNDKYSTNDINMYSTYSKKAICQIFDNMNMNFNESIIDIGCGKGFGMYNIYLLGFKKVHGIELSEELYQIAKRNFMRLNLSDKLTIEHKNAIDYNFELDKFTYIYMFNPFNNAIMENFICNIKQSVMRNPRELIIIYSNPRCHNTIINSKFIDFYYKKEFKSIKKGLVYYYRVNLEAIKN